MRIWRTLEARLTLVVVATLLWLIPRFARQDSIFGLSFAGLTGSDLGDAAEYIRYTDFFRSGGALPDPPFVFRPIMPAVASLLPWDPLVSLSAVGVACIIFAAGFVLAVCYEITNDLDASTLGALMFSLSFPTFYYSSIGIVDPLSVALCALAALLVIRRAVLWSAFVFALAVLSKESTISALPFFVVFVATDQGARTSKAFAAGSFLLFAILSFWASRNVFIPAGVATMHNWPIGMDITWENLSRARTYATLLLGVGLQGFIAVYWWIKRLTGRLSYLADPFMWGGIGSIVLFSYSILSAYSDARFLWVGQIFTSVVAADVISKYLERRNRNIGKHDHPAL